MKHLRENLLGNAKVINEAIKIQHAVGDMKNADFIEYNLDGDEVIFRTWEQLKDWYGDGDEDDTKMLMDMKKMKPGDYFITFLWVMIKL